MEWRTKCTYKCHIGHEDTFRAIGCIQQTDATQMVLVQELLACEKMKGIESGGDTEKQERKLKAICPIEWHSWSVEHGAWSMDSELTIDPAAVGVLRREEAIDDVLQLDALTLDPRSLIGRREQHLF